MTSRFTDHTLSNGLRIVIETMPDVKSVAAGFLVRTGARDDSPALAGVSHYLEHMCFKGTATRTWDDINIAFDEMGSNYNAYTSKDRTFYYGWVRTSDFERQLELLADMMRSVLPPDEFETEKSVILEEIAMSGDDLASCAYDFLYEQACAGTPLAWPVLGYEQTIEAMTRDQMHAYFTRRYAPSNLVLIMAGNIDLEQAIRSAERLCGGWAPVDPGPRIPVPQLHTGRAARVLERFRQQAVLIAFPSAPASHPLDETAEAAAAILGGVNSRFYWNIMQKGLSQRAGVFREEFADTGLLTMFALCEPENIEKVYEAMRTEARRLVEDGPEEKELQRVKNLRRTSLAIESEAPYYRLGQIADDVDYLGRPRTTQERLAEVDAISRESIAEYFRTFPITGEGMVVGVGPRAWPE